MSLRIFCICLSLFASHMHLTDQSKVTQNSPKDAEWSIGSHFDLLIMSEFHYSTSVNFTNVSLLVPKVTSSLTIALFSFYGAKDLPSSSLKSNVCLYSSESFSDVYRENHVSFLVLQLGTWKLEVEPVFLQMMPEFLQTHKVVLLRGMF